MMDGVTGRIYSDGASSASNYASADQANTVNNVYEWLRNQSVSTLDSKTDLQADLITAEDFAKTTANVTVGEMNESTGKYNTDMEVTLAVMPSTQNDDMVMKVLVEGEVVKTSENVLPEERLTEETAGITRIVLRVLKVILVVAHLVE